MVDDSKKEDGLEMFFAEAQADAARNPSNDLMARVLADAADVQAVSLAQGVMVMTPAATGGGVAGLLSAIGGWFGASGVVAAGLTGLVMGFYLPDQIDTVLNGQVSSILGEDAANLLPGFETLTLTAMAE